jgi:3-oxoadipate enol-lactonase
MKANVNGIEAYYEVHGAEGKPWLVFSHSLACNVRMWDGQVEAFKDRYRVLCYDTRGHGQSAAPQGPYTLEGLADDLKSLLEHLGVKKANFVGLSMGGMIGQTFALKYPGVFETLTLADTTSRYPAGAASMWQERIKVAETKGMEALVQGTLERWFTPGFRQERKAEVDRVAAQILKTPVAGYVGCCHAIPRFDVTDRLKELKLRALVVCGEEDPATPPAMARDIEKNLPGARLALIPRAAHLANIEQPAAFNRALADFLRT